jgi:4-hydroxyphenylpyruvate dioxygenase
MSNSSKPATSAGNHQDKHQDQPTAFTQSSSSDRENIAHDTNPLGLAGIEFIEYATSKPQALGQVLEMMGFRPIARHRSREVMLYRQGAMNVIVNAHDAGLSHSISPDEKPVIAAIALRVRDAQHAYNRALELGAWGVPTQVAVMELNIPAIHGVGSSRIFFVDRFNDFSIYDVDFVPIPTVDQNPPSTLGFHFFGIVQYIGNDRMLDWMEFYKELFGFEALPQASHFGMLTKGRILKSPCQTFFLQLIEPELGVLSVEEDERLQRLAFGTPNVPLAVEQLKAKGVEFVSAHSEEEALRGALTRTWLGSLSFELVKDGA